MSADITTLRYEQLNVEVFPDRASLGARAGEQAASWLRQRLSQQPQVTIIFAAAPSQNEFLTTLAAASDIDWARVRAFHMDEYLGLPAAAEQRFARYLQSHLFDLVKPGEVHLIPTEGDADEICQGYIAALNAQPLDMVCLGIGENGHLAFNDPPVADFRDPQAMKVVELDEACRQQQVNDGCFAAMDAVPTHALTLTIPTLLSAERLFCMVPGATKRQAVRVTLLEPVSTACPATILRQHPGCTLYTDAAAFAGVKHD